MNEVQEFSLSFVFRSKCENPEVEVACMQILTQFKEQDCIGANDAMSCFRNKHKSVTNLRTIRHFTD